MERQTRVAVFESTKASEIQLIKSKLDEAGIKNFIVDNYMTFTTTPTATMMILKVNLQDEKKAFDIIDAFLQETELNLDTNLKN